ncbi:Hpt domain-containing protein [Photobacterium sanctipauli]|uniref:Hpt domain-containing protein n=1 Tax=Photobacterium sanctipauli TaxID=1342794 RepID=A0A2T3NXM4_9GAMM|nr:Hpt domain-containing protein [Photobacterium sanctipauli]PSW21047.1 Hpt domain-containing protein [Photobacterium sanctipauli]
MKLSMILLMAVSAGGAFAGFSGMQLGYVVAAISGLAAVGCAFVMVRQSSVQQDEVKQTEQQPSERVSASQGENTVIEEAAPVSDKPVEVETDAALEVDVEVADAGGQVVEASVIEGSEQEEKASRFDDLLVFDIQHILDSMDNDHESVAMLLEIFLEEHADDGEKLKRYLDAGDLTQVKLVAHSLKGVAGSLGAQQLRAVTEYIEHTVSEGGQIDRTDCQQFITAIAKVELEITEHLKQCQAEISSLADNDEQMIDSIIEKAEFEEYNAPEPAQFVENQPAQSIEEAKTSGDLPAKIDVNFLLDSLDGDQDTALMLLEIFIEEHAGDGQALIKMVESNPNDEQALRLVHSLKGVSGSLGAAVLNSLSADLELKLKQQQTVSMAECQQLDQVLTETVASAKDYLAEVAVA